jgi:4,5-dihydroxyphthalate decarboxylase
MSFSFAASITDRTAPILLGTVSSPDLALDFHRVGLEDIFLRQMQDAEFDIAECSLASYLIAVARGEQRLTAIPVFLSRMFRHSGIYVRADAPYYDLASLRGKRFGMPEYQMTAGIWVRALLREIGVRNEDVAWVTFRPERIPIPSPAMLREGDPFTALLAGEVDAIFTARRPPAALLPLDGSAGKLRRLFADPWGEERAYYARTQIFPIMHLVSLRADTVAANPHLPRAAYDLFEAARVRALGDLSETIYCSAALPFLGEAVEGAHAVLGENFWRYGVAANWPALAAIMEYLIADGLMERALTPAEMFAPGVLDT